MAKKVSSPSEDFDGLDIDKDLANLLHWGNSDSLKREIISTGIPILDKILGGGLRRGSFVQVYGDFSTGKTYFTQMCIKSFQEKGYRAVLIDAERSFTAEWYSQLGIDVEKLIVTQPLTGEIAADLAAKLAGQPKGAIDLIIIDSLAALMPTAEYDKDVGESVMGRQAMLINRLLRKVTAVNENAVVIGINQTRTSLGVSYGDPTVLPGGKAPGFFSTHIIKMKRAGWLTEGSGSDQHRVGFNMVFEVQKNKMGNPFQECSIPFYYGKGLSMIHALIDLGIQCGVITVKSGGRFSYKGEPIAHGRAALVEWLELNPDVQEEITQRSDSVDDVEDPEEEIDPETGEILNATFDTVDI